MCLKWLNRNFWDLQLSDILVNAIRHESLHSLFLPQSLDLDQSAAGQKVRKAYSLRAWGSLGFQSTASQSWAHQMQTFLSIPRNSPPLWQAMWEHSGHNGPGMTGQHWHCGKEPWKPSRCRYCSEEPCIGQAVDTGQLISGKTYSGAALSVSILRAGLVFPLLRRQRKLRRSELLSIGLVLQSGPETLLSFTRFPLWWSVLHNLTQTRWSKKGKVTAHPRTK